MRRGAALLLALSWWVLASPASGNGSRPSDRLTRLRELHRRSQPDSVRVLAQGWSVTPPFDAPGPARRDLLWVWGQSEASFGRGRFAEPLLREALSLSRQAHQDSSAAALLRWVGVAVGLQGRIAEADSIYTELLAAARDVQSEELEGWSHVGLGWCALQRGQLERCVDENRAARQLHAAAGSTVGYSWAMNAEAIALRRLGRFIEARALYEETIERSRELPGATMLHAMSLANRGNLDLLLGDPQGALEAFRRSEFIHRSHQHEREAALVALDRCVTLLELSRESEAIAALDSLRGHCQEHGWMDLEAHSSNELAKAQRSMGQPLLALRTFAELRARPELPLRARADAEQGERDVLLELGRYQEVLDYLETAPAVEEPEIRCRRAVSRSKALRGLNRLDAARSEILRHTAADSLARVSTADRLDVLIEASRVCRATGQRTSSRDLLERAASIWEEFRAASKDLRWREQRAIFASRIYPSLACLTLESGPDAEAISDLFQRMQRAKARTLMERIGGPSAIDRLEAPRDPAHTLRAGELLLDLHVGEEEGVLFVADREGLLARRVDGARAWRPRLARLRTVPFDSPLLGTIRQALLRELLGGELARVEHARTVYWSADGPFLTSAGSIAPDWSLLPCWSLLSQLRSGGEEVTGSIVTHVVGNENAPPMPYARREVRWLRRRYSYRATGEDRLWPTGQVGSVHFAGHVAAALGAPWTTRLVVIEHAPSPRRVWPAWKIAAMSGAPAVVVLSGCSTVSGREIPGEGLSGLATAFLCAGSRSVVATRWPVEDRFAARFVETFYAGLDEGLTLGQSLARARRTHRSSRGQPDSFVILGDPDLRVRLDRH